MTKDDKLKEKLAEERHEDLIAVALGAFGFAGVSVAFAYWQIAGKFAGIAPLLLLVVAFAVLVPVFNRRKRLRETLIEKSDNQEQNTKSQTPMS
jgi:O-antigen ligase